MGQLLPHGLFLSKQHCSWVQTRRLSLHFPVESYSGRTVVFFAKILNISFFHEERLVKEPLMKGLFCLFLSKKESLCPQKICCVHITFAD